MLESSKDSTGNFVWKSEEGCRTIFPIQITSLEPEKSRIEATLEENTKEMNEGEQVYLKLDSKESAFKAEVILKVGIRIVLSFPNELVLAENRSRDRHYFFPEENKRVTLKTEKKTEMQELTVLDISEKGICISLKGDDHASFIENYVLRIEALGGARLEQAIVGKVISKIATEEGYRLGIHLSDSIPNEIFEQFILRKDFSLTHAQIVRDEAFRTRVRQNMSQVKKTLIARKNFKTLFETFDRPESNCQYLKHHVEMLCDVMAGLGTKLQWVHEDSIDKLIYVAYLHDIRFSQCPKVARISTKREFELIQENLTEEERKAFLEAPSYAAELAKQDYHAFPDAVKILLQQKELPDGTGYPYGIGSNAFSPLSCLFIVSHFFVDYVLRYPDWSIDDFVKSNRSRMKGVYFAKVLQAMEQV